uniref:Presequence translocase associated motor 16 n=1 Tax=Apteryx owenii TaxID=8824 RepID=A0A8B9Q2Q0_APTOW
MSRRRRRWVLGHGTRAPDGGHGRGGAMPGSRRRLGPTARPCPPAAPERHGGQAGQPGRPAATGLLRGRGRGRAKYLAQIILVGAQVVGRAFARALRQEFAASRAAADARGRSERPQSAAASRITGISLQEAQQILNVSNLNAEEIQKNYDHLFKVNDKSVGGSFYLQSKVVRAKERLDEELRIQAQSEKEKGWKAET